MAYVKIMVHAVWGTKYRQPILDKPTLKILLDHIRENAKAKKIRIDIINGQPDHIHCLFRLNADMAVSKAIQLLKGESSHWMNKNNITARKFEWAVEYYAGSVSDSLLSVVRSYIRHQEEHHRKKNFEREFNLLVKDIEDEVG